MVKVLSKTDGLFFLLALDEISTGIGYFIHSPDVINVTNNVIPNWILDFTLPSNLIGLLYTVIPIGVIYFERRFFEFFNRSSFYWLIFFLLIQQVLLVLSAIGSIIAVLNGAYLDGTVIPRLHIFDDQNVYIYAAAVQALVGIRLIFRIKGLIK